MKNILGLDLGTNSIGWAVISTSEDTNICPKIKSAGSRIIPMDAATLGDFDKGNTKSQTAERTAFRGARRIRERYLLRRERLLRVLHQLHFLPSHFEADINFIDHPGQIKFNKEPKLAWSKNNAGQYEFIFKQSFEEMLADFVKHQSHIALENKGIPYDWTIYYLRKKALTEKISNEELAWILLNFNQKRGYYQLRGEDEEDKTNKLVEFYALKAIKVEPTGEKRGNDVWYNIYLENDWIYRRTSKTPLNLAGKTLELIVTTDLNDDGTLKLNKDGEIKRSFRAPKEDDWTLRKKKTELEIEKSGKTVGCFIYDELLNNPKQKIRGEFIRTIERKFYKLELKQILRKQIEFHPELRDKNVYHNCINELYPHNEAYRQNIQNRDFVYLFVNNIIFYQRPLKSKKSSIADCPYEEYQYIDKETGEIIHVPLKCIAKSNPLYQEFRLWQFLYNIHIYQKERILDGKSQTDVDVTNEFLKTENDYVALFEWLNDLGAVDQKTFLKYPPFSLKKQLNNYRWNYVEDKFYPCNETRYDILVKWKKAGIGTALFNTEIEKSLWHILYSVNDKIELEKALQKFADKYQLGDSFVEVFKKFPPFVKDYGAYSEKAIKKLLSLMRMGKYWKENEIDDTTKRHVTDVLNQGIDESIPMKANDRAIHLANISDFKGLPLWQACYIVYKRFSEIKDIAKWKSPEDLDCYIKSFRQHSLRNPIVEQIILESLRVVRDIWMREGHIDEIHIELGREMKNSADKRKRMSEQISANENTNLRIKALMSEFINSEYGIENIRPYSPSQQELFRIYEEGALNTASSVPEEILDIIKKFEGPKQPTKSEFMRYKLWLEQKYRSPYTGEIIPLSKLFTPAYEIEHVIPQSRYFDDSLSNKVICESEVNKKKGNLLGYEFIKAHYGEIIPIGFGKSVKILSVDDYEKFVKDNYARNNIKIQKLMMEEIPEKFILRQLNDTRYISKVVKTLLSNIVREKRADGNYEPEAISKNVIVCTGGITDRLKTDWGIKDIWNEIVYPRFERMNTITHSSCYGHWENKEGKRYFQTEMPLEFQKGFNKKRIDHRHHAMDALVIACASRNIVNYLNNESASINAKINRQDLQRLLCEKRKNDENGNYKWIIRKPWATYTEDVSTTLKDIIVSFKQNLRVINKTNNNYSHYNIEGKKVICRQRKGDNWAIRKPLHKATVFGRVNLRFIKEVRLSVAINNPNSIVDKKLKNKIKELYKSLYTTKQIEAYFKSNISQWEYLNPAKVKIYYYTDDTTQPMVAVRKSLDSSFTSKVISESITDTGIQKILLKHLEQKNNDPVFAFSSEGIDEMNVNIEKLNDGKKHQPIRKVRIYETLGNKFAIGETGNKTKKFAEAEKGTNLFFAIYQNDAGKRSYETIPLNIVIEREKQGALPVPEQNDNGDKLLFWLSPNDLVYLPTTEELETAIDYSIKRKERIFKIISFTDKRLYGIPYNVASSIVDKLEYSLLNKIELTDSKESIKAICVPLKVNRLGEIVEINNRNVNI